MSLQLANASGYTEEQIDLIKRTICRGANDDELAMFMMICNRTGLDPFSRQIHAVKRWNAKTQREEMSMQTGIDGFRLIAERTGKYAGNDDPLYDSEDGQHPNKATVTVWKIVNGQRVPFTRSARWSEFVQTNKDGVPTKFWQKMPYLMLGKVAEALALRTAFPQELSGLYTTDEMGQAENDAVIDVESHPRPTPRPQPTTRPQLPERRPASPTPNTEPPIGGNSDAAPQPDTKTLRDSIAKQVSDAESTEQVTMLLKAAAQQVANGQLTANDDTYLRACGFASLLKLADSFDRVTEISVQIDKAESAGRLTAEQADRLRNRRDERLAAFPH